jgi:hypothetical protein
MPITRLPTRARVGSVQDVDTVLSTHGPHWPGQCDSDSHASEIKLKGAAPNVRPEPKYKLGAAAQAARDHSQRVAPLRRRVEVHVEIHDGPGEH